MIERIIVGLLATNAYIFSEWKKECILIDPGADAQSLIAHMNLINMKPRGILCTHGHLDHIAAAGLIKDHFHSLDLEVPIAIHEKDSFYLGMDSKSVHRNSFSSMGAEGDSFFRKIYEPLPEPDILLKEGDFVFDSNLQVLHTPGHSEGSICLYSENFEVLFSGDTLFFEGIGRTDLPGGNTENLKQSVKTKKILNLPENTRVFPGHGPNTTIERELKHNPFLF